MAPHAPTDERDPRSTPGASAVAPTGTNAVVVYSDLRCPWAHVAVHRLLTEVDRRGLGSELHIDHRWFPLDDASMPSDLDALDRKLHPVRELAPGAGWQGWAGSGAHFPATPPLIGQICFTRTVFASSNASGIPPLTVARPASVAFA